MGKLNKNLIQPKRDVLNWKMFEDLPSLKNRERERKNILKVTKTHKL